MRTLRSANLHGHSPASREVYPRGPATRCSALLQPVLIAACLSALLGGRCAPLLADTETPVELSPYRVRISVAVDGGPEATSTVRRELFDGVHQQLLRTVGRLWSMEIEENNWLWPADRTGLQRLSEADLSARLGDAAPDKAYLLAIETAGPRLRLSGREWDAATRRLGPVHSLETADRRGLPEAAVALIGRLFQPLLSIETIEPDGLSVRLRLRGGALLAAADSHERLREQVRPGDLLQPLLRYLDRDRNLREVQQVPWTYLHVDSVDRGRVAATLISGLRAPLGTGSFRRVEPVALGLQPQTEATSLQLVARDQPPRPMAGFKVRVVPKTHPRDEPQAEERTALTDRDGQLRIEAQPEHPLVWLYIHSGEALLARVPFLPGIEPSATIELPDDSLRLATEGEIDVLKGRLIDTVARRAALMARIRKLAREGDWQNIDQPRRELSTLPGIREFQSQLNAIRVPALEAAAERRDRIAAARIRQLCDEAADLVRRYLDPDAIRELNEEVEELRRLDAGN